MLERDASIEHNFHITTVTSYWARWRIRSTVSRLFVQPFIQAQIKGNIKAPRHWPSCGEVTGDRWISYIVIVFCNKLIGIECFIASANRSCNLKKKIDWLLYHNNDTKVNKQEVGFKTPVLNSWEKSSFWKWIPMWIKSRVLLYTCPIHHDTTHCMITSSNGNIFRVALLAMFAGNSPVTGEFPAQRPARQSFDIFFDLCLSKRLNEQSWSWWFETPPR